MLVPSFIKVLAATYTYSLSLILQPTVSRPVCLGMKHPSGAYDQIFITVWHLRVCWCGALCLTRGRFCRLQVLLTLASAVILGSEFRGTRDNILLSQIRYLYQSQSYIATDGQSISKSWCRAPSGAHDSYSLTVSVLFFGSPSLTRGRACLLYMLLGLASVVFLGSESLWTRHHILLSQIWEFSFRRLLRLAGSRLRYYKYNYSCINAWDQDCQMEITRKITMKIVVKPAQT
jgi:hypothetical protein